MQLPSPKSSLLDPVEEGSPRMSQHHMSIVVSHTWRQFNQVLLTHLREVEIEVQYSDLDPMFIQITPSTGIFWLNPHVIEHCAVETILSKYQLFRSRYSHSIVVFLHYTTSSESEVSTVSMTQTMCGLLAYLALHDHAGCIPVRNESDFALCILSITKREQIKDTPPNLSRCKRRCQTLADAQTILLEGLHNCGPKKIKIIKQAFHSPQAFFQALFQTPEQILALPKFGSEFVVCNQRLLSSFFPKEDNHD